MSAVTSVVRTTGVVRLKNHRVNHRAATRRVSSEIVVVTPERALALLEHNTINRPLSQPHVARIAQQILDGKWKFNGDTIKIAATGDIVDGQHRLWAIAEAKTPVETVVVYGVERDAFATIDTLSKPRTGGDILALNGLDHNRRQTAAALAWLIRWGRKGAMVPWGIKGRVENSEIEAAYSQHPAMAAAVDRVSRGVRGLCSVGLVGFLYYIIADRNTEIAERMIETLESPAGVPTNDPFFRLRAHMTASLGRQHNPVLIVALAIKAANTAKAGKRTEHLSWKSQGRSPEPFPKLDV